MVRVEQNNFSKTIMELRYSHEKPDGILESWDDIANRVVDNVFSVVSLPKDVVDQTREIIKMRKFIPGGRFLAQSGREYHQVNNCYDKNTPVVTENGVIPIKDVQIGVKVLTDDGTFQTVTNKLSQGYREKLLFIKVDKMPDVLKITPDHKILTQRGWIRADNIIDGDFIKIPGYKDNLPIPSEINILDYVKSFNHEIINGRIVRLNSGNSKNKTVGKYDKRFKPIVQKIKIDNNLAKFLGYYLAEGCAEKSGYRTLITFSGDEYKYAEETKQLFIDIFGLEPRIIDNGTWLQVELSNTVVNEFLTNFIGDSFDNKKLPYWMLNTNREFKLYLLSYVCRGDGHTKLESGSTSLTMCNKSSMMQMFFIAQELGIAYSFKYQNRVRKETHIPAVTLLISNQSRSDNFLEFLEKLDKTNLEYNKHWRKIVSISEIDYNDIVWDISVEKNHSLQIAGMVGANCFLLRAEDTREGWGDLASKATIMLMSGGGIGIDYSQLRPSGGLLKRSGGTSSGVLPLVKTINEIGRGVMSGGKRRSAIWAGLNWQHKDIFDFITLKNWIPEVRAMKEKDYDFPATADMTNISVLLDKTFFDAFENPNHQLHSNAQEIYWATIERMCKTGEPGFSIDYNNPNESLRNACCEIVSEDDSDVCCLGSINLANIDDIDELKYVTELAQLFLIVGTEYSDKPTDKTKVVQQTNRRTGLGLMGLHEWLLLRNKPYDIDPELGQWLHQWKEYSNSSAKYWSNHLSFNEPIAKRSIAPNGTISLAGGQTTSGIEPIFAVAYKRRYLTPDGWKMQYVVDAVAEKLVESGISPDDIEDAYQLSLDVERRVKFQRFVQLYVDNAISSTINLPKFGTPGNDDPKGFGNMLINYLPELRGMTVYPDGSRGGQPISVISYGHAIKHKDTIFDAREDCIDGVCGL